MPRRLEIRGLTRRFGGVAAVRSLDLAVDDGELVSLIGPNGAGKTTTFNMVSGLDRRTKAKFFSRASQSSACRRKRSPRSESRALSSTAGCSPI